MKQNKNINLKLPLIYWTQVYGMNIKVSYVTINLLDSSYKMKKEYIKSHQIRTKSMKNFTRRERGGKGTKQVCLVVDEITFQLLKQTGATFFEHMLCLLFFSYMFICDI